jgi:hypothetical protein
VAHGRFTAAITAVSAVALVLLLGAMEALEVSVIDRWQSVFPGRPRSYLAGWLASRQLFVALIVTAATLLANRSALVIPGTSSHIETNDDAFPPSSHFDGAFSARGIFLLGPGTRAQRLAALSLTG